VAGKSLKEIGEMIKEHKIKCPKCGKSDFTEARFFNLMFKTHQGVVEEKSSAVYLRPETAQGIFVNFKNVTQTSRKRIPFGIAQIGKAFRNEITPGNFTFRTREFEQMEIEYFVSPKDKTEIKKKFDEWKEACRNWYLALGIKEKNMRFREHAKDELSHYSSMTYDIEYEFPFGWGELMGIAYRGDYDLTQHQKFSGKDLQYLDQLTNEKYIPHVIEPSFGLDRAVLITLLDAYEEDTVEGEPRTIMHFDPKIAPVKAAIFPLMKKEEISKVAQKVFEDLKEEFAVEYDEAGAIGKRYRRQDEIGTPFCITIDFDTLTDKKVTLRDRDTTKQERVDIAKIRDLLRAKIQ
jgi:glycyl-tRNA synthetase